MKILVLGDIHDVGYLIIDNDKFIVKKYGT